MERDLSRMPPFSFSGSKQIPERVRIRRQRELDATEKMIEKAKSGGISFSPNDIGQDVDSRAYRQYFGRDPKGQ